MSWLQQLIGKLKSVFRRESASGEATTEAGTPARVEAAVATKEEPATVAEETPAVAPEAVAEEAAPADEPVKEEAPATTESTAPAEVEVPAATAEPAEVEPSTGSDLAAATDSPVAAEEPAAVEDAKPEPVAEAVTAEEPAVEAAPQREATNPAISTLDVEGITAELKAEGPYGPSSGKPAADGSAPSADFTVKAKESSKLFHTEKSPYFTRTKADVWFKTEADAESAGFQAWDHKKRAGAKK